MRPLLWKEWHEQRWKLGFGCVVLCAFALIGLRTRIVSDESIIVATCALGVLLLPVLTAAGLIPAERDGGTLQSLLALPVETWKVLAAKSVLGILLCAGPLLSAAIISLAVTRGREISSADTLAIYTRAAATAISLLIWMVPLTSRSASEGRAAALAIGALVFWLMTTAGLLSQNQLGLSSHMIRSHAPSAVWAACPFVFVFPPTNWATLLGIIVQCAVAVVLCMMTLRAMTFTDPEARP